MKRLLLALLLLAAPASAATLNRGNGGEPESLDPHFAGTSWEENIIADLLVGLTTLDAAGKPIPGMAERWDVSPDGLTWTFHLRKATWSDGAPVTADDFAFAFRRLLNPKTGARGAAGLWILRNASAVNSGKLPAAALGVAAPKPGILILTLEHPAPYLPELLTHLPAMPVPVHSAEKKDAAWTKPGSYVGNGPYLLKSWTPNDKIVLAKNPHFYDAAHVSIDTVNYFPTTDAQAALRRFRAGELDLQSPAPLTEVPWLRANMPTALKVTPALAVSYIALNLNTPALKDARVRRALNLAIDRETITGKILKLGEPPAYGIVPPGVAHYSGAAMNFRSTPQPQRLVEAQRLMQAAGFGPANRLALSFAITASPDNRRLAAVIQAMTSQIWVKLSIDAADVPIHFRKLRTHQYEMGIANWFADFNDASNFLDLLRSDAGNNYAAYRNPVFDGLMQQAAHQPDAAKRGVLLAAAEKTALADYPWIPLRFQAQTDLVSPRVEGWIANPPDFHASRWLTVR